MYSYGMLGNDRRNVLSVAYSWLLPPVKTGITNAILGNWQMSGFRSCVSGAPLQVVGGTARLPASAARTRTASPISNANINGSPDIAVMPVLTCDPRGSGDLLVLGRMLPAPAAGQIGNYIWPNITGPSYMNHDLSVFKNFPFGGNRKFQFRLSAYNVFNHPQRALDDPRT